MRSPRLREMSDNVKNTKNSAIGRAIGSVIFFGRPKDVKFTDMSTTYTGEKTQNRDVTTVRCGEENKDKGVIIFCPPQAGNVTSTSMQQEMQALAKKTKKMVIGLNYNSAPKSEHDLYNDCKAVIEHFRGKDEFKSSFENMTIYGRSLGGAVAIHVAADMYDKGTAEPNVIADRTFSKLTYAIKALPGIRALFSEKKLGSPRENYDPEKKHGSVHTAGWAMDSEVTSSKIPPGKLTIINAARKGQEPGQGDDMVLKGRAQMTSDKHKDYTHTVHAGVKDLHNYPISSLHDSLNYSALERVGQAIDIGTAPIKEQVFTDASTQPNAKTPDPKLEDASHSGISRDQADPSKTDDPGPATPSRSH